MLHIQQLLQNSCTKRNQAFPESKTYRAGHGGTPWEAEAGGSL